VQFPFFGPGTPATTRNIEYGLEQFPAKLLDRGIAGCDAASVDVDQIMPAPRNRRTKITTSAIT
jgi:hypothetical protein